jgi:DNA-binding transcriptional LysR family regulator
METIKSLNGLLAFLKVSEFRSFSVAARELKVSKAYLSKLIQNHENEVGQKLLHRTTRMVKLTLEGEKYFEVCAHALAKMSAAHHDLKANSETPRGLLRITAAGAFAEKSSLHSPLA